LKTRRNRSGDRARQTAKARGWGLAKWKWEDVSGKEAAFQKRKHWELAPKDFGKKIPQRTMYANRSGEEG